MTLILVIANSLGARLRSDGESLGPGDLTHIDEVIAALKELVSLLIVNG